MLRIVALEKPGTETALSLEGHLIGPWVDELRRSCELILATGASLTLDLSEVAFVERRGVQFLQNLVEGGVTAVNCPAFICEQLKALSRC